MPLDPNDPGTNAPPNDPNPPPPDDDNLDDDPAPSGGDPVKALHAERGRRKETSKALKAAQAEVARLKPLADEYQTILPVLPELLANAQRPQQPAPNQPQEVDPEVLALAQDLNLVTDDGQYDVVRASRLMQRLDNRAGRVAAVVTNPIRQTSAAAAATQIREKAYKAVDKDGQPYATRAAIDQVFNSLPPESLTDANNAVMALVIARGLGGPGAGDDEPLHIEGAGRGGGRPAALSPMERAIAKMRGKTEAQWRGLATEDVPNWALEDE